MSNNPIFQYNTNGSYPNETYSITPLTTNTFWSQDYGYNPLYPYLFRHYLNHHKNPLKKVIDPVALSASFQNYIDLGNSTIQLNNYPIDLTSIIPANNARYIENINVISLGDPNSDTQAANITFYANQLRTDYLNPYVFYFYYFTDPVTLQSNGAMLYPEHLFIKPNSLTYSSNNDTWDLNVKLKTLDSKFISLSSGYIETEAYITHRARLSSLPNYSDLTLNNDYRYNYSIYASRMRYDYPIIKHGATIPAYISANIDSTNDIVFIYPNSTFISFSADYIGYPNININDLETTQQVQMAQLQQTPNYLKPFQTFNASFISSAINIQSKNTFQEVFQLIQNITVQGNLSVPLSDFSNSVYYVNIKNGLQTSSLDVNAIASSKIKAVKDTYIGLNYIADCTTMANLKTKTKTVLAKDTCTKIGNATLNSLGSTGFIEKLDEYYGLYISTKYPPHNYSYRVDLQNPTTGNFDTWQPLSAYAGLQSDSTTLNFYLKLSSNIIGNTAILSAYIASDFNALSYSFTPETQKNYAESIAYQVISTSLTSINDFINSITCTYGYKNTSYTLTPSNQVASYVPVISGKDFTIVCNNNNFQNIYCVLKASLKTAAGILDTYEPILLTFNVPSQELQSGVFLNIVNQQSNNITLDSSFNISVSSWPYVDLTDSNIIWDWNINGNKPSDIVNYVTFSYVDLSGNYIAPAIAGESVPFNNGYTQILNVSGYGPNQIEITLKADNYDVVNVLTDPTLFNYLDAGTFIVNPITNLDNLNLTRTIQLSAAIPFDNKIYNIPSNIPIYWTWSYDGITDPNLIPISVNQILSSNPNADYVYSSNYAASGLSAIQINVTPGYSTSVPVLHQVTVTASTDVVSPSVSGSFSFYVDDFPDPSIFNADFKSYYYVDSSSDKVIADTSIGNITVTRPDNSSLQFLLQANQISKNVNCNHYEWTLNNNITVKGALQYSLLDLSIPNKYVNVYNSYGYSITSARLAFNLLSATVTNWISAHNISAYTDFYIIDNKNFYNPLQFLIYPEYAWLFNDPTHVTLLSTNPLSSSYFTNSFRPSAYGNKISNSQTFWVSANKSCFDEYLYQNLNNNEVIPALSSYELIDIPYNFNNSLTTVPISLVAYNSSFYPESFINNSYLIYKNNTFFTEYYQLTTQTIDISATNNVYNNFFLSPCILPYNDLILNYTLNQTDIELDNNSNISIVQYLSSSGNGPAVILDGSTVTYYLSNQYWTASATVPAISGIYSLFNLKIGDPADFLHAGDGLSAKDSFNLYAKTNILQQIPPSTFNQYTSSQYTGNRNLWVTLSGI